MFGYGPNNTYVCFDCRTTRRAGQYAKTTYGPSPRCAECRKVMTQIHPSSKAPKARDDKGWKALRNRVRDRNMRKVRYYGSRDWNRGMELKEKIEAKHPR